MTSLLQRHEKSIVGVLSCWDRVVIQGNLPGFGHSEGMTSYLYARKIRVFDYTKFAEPLREDIRSNAERLATDSGIEIQFVRKSTVRKEGIVEEILKGRGSPDSCASSRRRTIRVAHS